MGLVAIILAIILIFIIYSIVKITQKVKNAATSMVTSVVKSADIKVVSTSVPNVEPVVVSAEVAETVAVVGTEDPDTDLIEISAFGVKNDGTEKLLIKKYTDDVNAGTTLFDLVLNGAESPNKFVIALEKGEKLLFRKIGGNGSSITINIKKDASDITNKLFLTRDFSTNVFPPTNSRYNTIKSGKMHWNGYYLLEE